METGMVLYLGSIIGLVKSALQYFLCYPSCPLNVQPFFNMTFSTSRQLTGLSFVIMQLLV